MRAVRDANDDFGTIFALKTGQMTFRILRWISKCLTSKHSKNLSFEDERYKLSTFAKDESFD